LSGPRIPQAELEVLACLDRLEAATARQLRETMDSYRPMAHGSMMTLLKRLESRGLVDRRKAGAGKAFLFSASAQARRTYSSLLARLRERVFGGDPVALVASLFETAPPDSAQLRQLQLLLDRLRSEEESSR